MTNARSLARGAVAAEITRLATARSPTVACVKARRDVPPLPITRMRSPSCWLDELDDDTFDALTSALMHPLNPSVAGRLASCSRSLLKRLGPKLAKLRQQHGLAKSLCAKAGTTCSAMRDTKRVVWGQRDLNDGDIITFATLIIAGHLERIKFLGLHQNRISDVGAEALASALCGGHMRRLQVLDLSGNRIGADGRRALGVALGRPGALQSLVSISLVNNHRNLQLSDTLRSSLVGQVALARSCKRLISAKGLIAEC